MDTKIRAIITGSTGMAGEGVLHMCLQHPAVEAVLIVNRRPSGISHPKLKEIIHADFYDLTPIEAELSGYNACFFCLGITSVGMKEADYFKITHTLTVHMAGILCRLNPDMTFCYVSGAGTDSTEQGKSMWARVKGKTENDLMQLPFKQVFAFRPGFMKPIKGLQRAHRFYTFITWMFPIGRLLSPNGFIRLEELGLSMIHIAERGYDKKIINGRDMIRLAR